MIKPYNTLFKVLLLLYFISWTQLYSQNFNIQTITVEDGLSQDGVSCFLQDSFGFIWIGTYDGLNRYDGHEIINYRHLNSNVSSLSGNRILCLLEDSQKRIWIGTEGAGINYFSLLTEQFHRVNLPKPNTIVYSISETKSGDILIGTSQGLLKVKEGTVTYPIVKLPYLENKKITDMVMQDDSIYVATIDGTWILNEDTCIAIKHEERKTNSKCLAVDLYGNLWQGIDNRVRVLTSDKKIKVYNLPVHDNILSIITTKDNNLWIGTKNNGLFCLNTKTGEFIFNITKQPNNGMQLLDNCVTDLYCDESNTLWIANRKGLCHISLSTKSINSVPLDKQFSNLENNNVSALFLDDYKLYVGLYNKGLYSISLDENFKSEIVIEETISPFDIIKNNNGLLIATSNGIYKTSKGNIIKIENSNGFFKSICQDDYGNTYFTSNSGLFLLDKSGDNLVPIELNNHKLNFLKGVSLLSIQYDRVHKCIWVGSKIDGLYKLNLNAVGAITKVKHYKNTYDNNYFIANNSIWSMFLDDYDTLWLGTDSGLFFKTKKGEEFIEVRSENVINKKIAGIQVDRLGKMWLNNSKGIIYYDPITNKSKLYNTYDGFSSRSFNRGSAISKEGIIYLGGNDGIDYFDPSQIEENSFLPRLFFNKLKIHNKEVLPKKELFGSVALTKHINETQKITLSHSQNNFMLNFSCTSFSDINRVSYKYQLEGYDENPIEVSGDQNFASYTNLPKGDYIFWVKVANSDGVWNPEKRLIEFEILPPFWQTNLAYFLYVILGLATIFTFFYVFHKLKIKKIQQAQEREVNEMRLEFFTDIAHEFRTPLSLIIEPIRDLIKTPISEDQRQKTYSVISRNSKRLVSLINQLLDFRKINLGINILKVSKQRFDLFIKELNVAFAWQAKSKSITFRVEVPEQLVCFFDADILEKIMYNLLSNAFKFTPKNGTIEVKVKVKNKEDISYLEIFIKDSGKGIPDEEKLKVFNRFYHGKDRVSSGIGLHLTHKLIKAHKGDIWINDSAYGGAEFVVEIPVDESFYSFNEITEAQELESNKTIYIYEDNSDSNDSFTSQRNEKILIVEDDNELRSYLKNSLTDIFNVIEAENGLEGLSMAKTELPDLIVSDVMMPEMDGILFCKSLKQDEKTNHIPVIFLTAKTDKQFIKEGLLAGAWDYITKPFNADDIRQKVKNIITTRNNHKDYLIKQKAIILKEEDNIPTNEKFILRFTNVILKYMSHESFSIDDYAKEIGLSRMQLHRRLKKITGGTTSKFINMVKINYACEMFDKGYNNIKEVMHTCGFNNHEYFRRNFKKLKGMTPSQYIENTEKEMIKHNES